MREILGSAMDPYSAFWMGRGLIGAPPPRPQPAIMAAAGQQRVGGGGQAPPLPVPGRGWLAAAEETAAAGRAWVAFASDLVALAFKVLVLGAAAVAAWQGVGVVSAGKAAFGTEEGARSAGRTLNALRSEFSAPALWALGAACFGLLATVVLVLRGPTGGSGEQARPPPASSRALYRARRIHRQSDLRGVHGPTHRG